MLNVENETAARLVKWRKLMERKKVGVDRMERKKMEVERMGGNRWK